MSYKPRVLSLCSGIGAIDLAAVLAGCEIAGQVEINPFCRAVLLKNFGDVPRMADMKEVQGDEFGTIDIVAGGIPCQPFSSAGKQNGRDDDRYLWPEMRRIIKKAWPTWVLIENVDDFSYMALDDVSADLEAQGYEVQAFVLPACAVGAPHTRERCFVVAYSGSDRRWVGTVQYQPGRERVTTAIIANDGPKEPLAYTNSQGSQECRFACCIQQANLSGTPAGAERGSGARTIGDIRQPQSRLGRVAYGAAGWMDRHIWPARPGYPQNPQEPPRTIIGRLKWRKQRLEALGNAVVWQQVYPIFDAITQHYADSIDSQVTYEPRTNTR